MHNVESVQRLLRRIRMNTFTHPFSVIGSETSMQKMEILSIRRGYINNAKMVIFVPQVRANPEN